MGVFKGSSTNLTPSKLKHNRSPSVLATPRTFSFLLLTRVISLYTDGSHSKPDDKCGLPDLARWGFLALERTTAVTLHEEYDRVHCDITDPAYHGAATSSNNTGELTAIGEAITWISLQQPSPTSSHEICSDSTYALDAIDLTDPPLSSSSNKALIHWYLEGIRAARRQGYLLLFRKVKAHGTDKSLDTQGNNRADTLAELGRRTDQDHHLTSFLQPLSLTPSSPTVPTAPPRPVPLYRLHLPPPCRAPLTPL
eukprot:gene36470-biopygen6547